MAKLTIDIFSGEIPKLADHVLDAKNATLTLDAKVDSGELTAWQDDSKIENLTMADPITLYQYVQDDGATEDWFYSDEDLDFVNTPQSNDTYERVYFAGSENDSQIDVFNHPNYGNKELRAFPNDLDVAVDWDGDTHYSILGIEAPVGIPYDIHDQGDSAGRTVASDTDDYAYVYTYVTQHGEEGPPSSPSTAQTMDQEDLIKIYVKPPEGLGTNEAQMHEDFNYYIEKVRFYRTSAGVNSTDFLYVDEVLVSTLKTPISIAGGAGPWTTLNVTSYVAGTGVITTTEDWTGFTDTFDETDKWMYVEDQTNNRLYRITASDDAANTFTIGDSKPSALSSTIKIFAYEYTDDVLEADLGDVLATTTYVAPPQDLEGITSMANGYLFAWKGNTLYYSVAYLPHAWPVANVISIDQQIVACRGQANTLAIATEGFPYMFSGQSPRTFSKQKMGLFTPCLSKRCVVQIDGGILFPSTDGLMQLTLNGVENVTKSLIRTETWQSYTMSGAFALFGNNRYFAFPNVSGGVRGFMIDFTDGTFNELSPQAECGYRVPDTGLIYYISLDLGTIRSIKQWQGDSIALRSFTWKSKKFILPKEINMAAARLTIDSDFYDALLDQIEENAYLEGLNATIFADDVVFAAVGYDSYVAGVITLTDDYAADTIIPEYHRVQDNTTGKDYPIDSVSLGGGAGADTVTLATVAGGGGEASPPAALNTGFDIISPKDLEGDIAGGQSILVEGRVMASHQIAGDLLFSLNNLNALSTVNLIIYVDGTERFNRNIAGPTAFKLPKGFKGKEWQAQISGTIPVRRLEIAETMDEMSGNRRG